MIRKKNIKTDQDIYEPPKLEKITFSYRKEVSVSGSSVICAVCASPCGSCLPGCLVCSVCGIPS